MEIFDMDYSANRSEDPSTQLQDDDAHRILAERLHKGIAFEWASFNYNDLRLIWAVMTSSHKRNDARYDVEDPNWTSLEAALTEIR